MMSEAAELIAQAHAAGLIVVLWLYPRGKAAADEKIHTSSQVGQVLHWLLVDFVKVNPPSRK